MTYTYNIKPIVHNKIFNFYTNVAKKYRHAYSLELMNKNIHEACTIVFWWIDLTLTKADQDKIQLDVNYSKSHSATR